MLVFFFPVKESCYILLQTIPNHINVDSLCKELMNHFPTILNIHDLHVWEFTRRKTFLTAHIIFMNPQVCEICYPLQLLFLRFNDHDNQVHRKYLFKQYSPVFIKFETVTFKIVSLQVCILGIVELSPFIMVLEVFYTSHVFGVKY